MSLNAENNVTWWNVKFCRVSGLLLFLQNVAQKLLLLLLLSSLALRSASLLVHSAGATQSYPLGVLAPSRASAPGASAFYP